MAEKVVIGNAELWHGDCREVLPGLPKHDLLLTDPPYGLGERWTGGTWFTKGAYENDSLEWDDKPPPAWLFGLMQETCKAQIIWGGNYFGLPASRCWLAWVKRDNMPTMSDFELAWTSLDKPAKEFYHSRNGFERAHPTQKPTPVISWCLAQVSDASTVLDPFMGSGTTGVACAQLGKAFTGIERERKYFDIACERIERAQAQGRMFAAEPAPVPEQQGLGL